MVIVTAGLVCQLYNGLCTCCNSFHYPAENSGVNQLGAFSFIHPLLLKAHTFLLKKH